MVAASLAIYKTGGLSSRLPEAVLRLDAVEGDGAFAGRNVTQYSDGGRLLSFGADSSEKSVVLWGDSHADVALWALDSLSRDLGLAGVAFTRGGTPPVFQWSGWRDGSIEHSRIVQHNERVREYISGSNPSPEFVVIVFRWTHYIPRNRRMQHTPQEGFGESLVETIDFLVSRGSKVAVLMEPSVFDTHVPRTWALHEWRAFSPPTLSLLQHQQFNQDYAEIITSLSTRSPEVVLIDPLAAFLLPGDTIQSRDTDGTLLFRDEHHLTRRGAERLTLKLRDFFIK